MDHRVEYVVRFSHEERQWIATATIHDFDSPHQDSERCLGHTPVAALVGLVKLFAHKDAEIEQMAQDLYGGYGRPDWELCTNKPYWYERARKLVYAGWMHGKMP